MLGGHGGRQLEGKGREMMGRWRLVSITEDWYYRAEDWDGGKQKGRTADSNRALGTVRNENRVFSKWEL